MYIYTRASVRYARIEFLPFLIGRERGNLTALIARRRILRESVSTTTGREMRNWKEYIAKKAEKSRAVSDTRSSVMKIAYTYVCVRRSAFVNQKWCQ